MQRLSRGFWVAVAAGIAIRVALVCTSIGTSDVMYWTRWAQLVREHGIAGAYAQSLLLNHPPLSLLLLRAYDRIASLLGIELTDVLRLAQIAADVVTAFALVAIARAERAAILFLLSPAAIVISGFHCNTDPTMVALLVVSVACAGAGWDASAAAALAAASGIKIIALFAVPFVFLAAGRRVRFAATFATVVAATFLPTIVAGGMPVVRNIFFYSGYPGTWGLPALLSTLGARRAGVWYTSYGKLVVVAAVIVLLVRFARLGPTFARLVSSVPRLYAMVLFVAPGFGVQYLDWPLPLLPLATSRRVYVAVATASAMLLFLSYTFWSRGLPWWYADAYASPTGSTSVLIKVGLLVWATMGLAAFSPEQRNVYELKSLRTQHSALRTQD